MALRKSRLAISVGAFLLLACEPLPVASPIDKLIVTHIDVPVEHYRLENGLEVILHEDHLAPIVAVRLDVHAGRANSPRGKPGVAHLVEHLMFASPADGRRFIDTLTDVGAWNVGAETHADYTEYHAMAPRAALPVLLWAEAHRIHDHQRLVDDAQFQRERIITKNELGLRFQNMPGGAIYDLVRRAMLPVDHPYNADHREEAQSMDAITRSDEDAFFSEYYTPNDMTLVIAGDITVNDTRALVQKYFGGFEPSAARPRTSPAPVTLAGETEIHIDADVERPRVIVAWILPPADTPALAEAELAGHYLENVDAWTGLDGNGVFVDQNRDASFAFYWMTVGPSTTPKDALEHLDRSLHNLTEDDVSPAVFVFSRTDVLSSRLFALEALEQRARILSSNAFLHGDPLWTTKAYDRVRAATRSDIRDAAYQFFPQKKRVIAFVTPNRNAPPAGALHSAVAYEAPP